MAQWHKGEALGQIAMEGGTWPGEVTPPDKRSKDHLSLGTGGYSRSLHFRL